MQVSGKVDPKSFFGCSTCKSIHGSVESIHRSDGNVLQILTCDRCHHKWKELWVIMRDAN
jgi:hypothetical protein